MLNVHCDKGAARIDGIRVFAERILATADEYGFIKFHRVDELRSETISNQELEDILISKDYCYTSGGAFSHLDHDGDKLVRKDTQIKTCVILLLVSLYVSLVGVWIN